LKLDEGGGSMKQRYRNSLLLMFLGLIFFLVGCEFVLPQSEEPPSASLIIVEPVDGSQFQVGDLVPVRSQVTSPEGTVMFELLVNGQVYRSDRLTQALTKGTLLQPWQPSNNGKYTLQVSMATSEGKGLTSQVIIVDVIGESAEEIQLDPTTAVPPREETITPTITPTLTLTPTETLTPTLTPTLTLTWTPTLTYTPTTEPLGVPEPIAPSGSYSCRSTIFLEWNSVYSPNGIAYYEWVVESPGGGESGTTTDIEVEFFLPSCAASYRWHVRAVDNLGRIGQFSEWIDFSVE